MKVKLKASVGKYTDKEPYKETHYVEITKINEDTGIIKKYFIHNLYEDDAKETANIFNKQQE